MVFEKMLNTCMGKFKNVRITHGMNNHSKTNNYHFDICTQIVFNGRHYIKYSQLPTLLLII